jgi:hypothetical protein
VWQYESLKDYDQTLAQYHMVINLTPGSNQGYASQDNFYHHLERNDEVIGQPGQTVEIKSNLWWARVLLSQSYFETLNWDQTFGELFAAIELESENPVPFLGWEWFGVRKVSMTKRSHGISRHWISTQTLCQRPWQWELRG